MKRSFSFWSLFRPFFYIRIWYIEEIRQKQHNNRHQSWRGIGQHSGQDIAGHIRHVMNCNGSDIFISPVMDDTGLAAHNAKFKQTFSTYYMAEEREKPNQRIGLRVTKSELAHETNTLAR